MNTFENVTIIGLTGQSGAGKTTVSKIFSSNGFSVIDADAISRKVATNGIFLNEVAELFPDCVINGELERRKLAGIVFNDKKALDDYTSLIYPYITFEVFKLIRYYKSHGEKLILLDAPTLFESGLDAICDCIVSVTAPLDLKIQRILERDGIPYEMVHSRLSSQNTESYFANRSDYLISNDSTADELNNKTLLVIDSIKERFNA
ncbi:MAG: dephospho-CoA kinase [Oscillospiraceae bacterium]|nr:dephospho-CoA kinase [Oscillospiraceae bacterium]